MRFSALAPVSPHILNDVIHMGMALCPDGDIRVHSDQAGIPSPEPGLVPHLLHSWMVEKAVT